MEEEDDDQQIPNPNPNPNPPPHVLIFPFPVQGHVNSMLKLAELLCLAGGIQVTFLNSDHNHDRLLRFNPHIHQHFARFPGFKFQSISDGLPPDHPRSGDLFNDLFHSIHVVTKPLFRQLLISSPVTCVIADGIMTYTIDVAQDELGIPVICFRTISACCFWAYFCLPKLIESGELPFKDDDDMDMQISTSLPGMETSFLRRRDLPSFCQVKDISDPIFQSILTETRNTTRASGGLILNTLEDLEGPILSQIRLHCPKLYTIGPLYAFLKKSNSSPLLPQSSSHSYSNNNINNSSLWEEDRSCITWLDSQPLKSVVYVSFGSLTVVSKDKMLEFWHGLVNSGKRFLWVIRPHSVQEKEEQRDQMLKEEEQLMDITKERGCIVEWAPQQEVLGHRAVGAFLTHSGWNSTLESLIAGVPMICWPYFADQQINSRFVSQVWGVGLDMKDTCERGIVEKMVRDVMEEGKERERLSLKVENIAEMVSRSIMEGGSSYQNLYNLIEDIKCTSVMIQTSK